MPCLLPLFTLVTGHLVIYVSEQLHVQKRRSCADTCNHNENGRSISVMIYLGINAQVPAIFIAGLRPRRDLPSLYPDSLRQVLRSTLARIRATFLMVAYFPTAMEDVLGRAHIIPSSLHPFISVSSCLTPFAPEIHKTLLHLHNKNNQLHPSKSV